MARSRDPRSDPGFSNWDADPWLGPPPVAEAREGGESTWEVFHEASRRLDLAFAPTEPSQHAPLQESGAPGALSTAEALMVVARRNNRACPQPAKWMALYRRLHGTRHADLPAPPVQPAVWSRLSAMQKRLQFRDYVEWCERHRRLPVLAAFMQELAEADWVHMDDA